MTADERKSATGPSIRAVKTVNAWRRFSRVGLVLAILVYAPPRATEAATVTTTFLVTANIAVTCTIAATQLDFGDYAPLGANASSPLNGQSQLTVTCTKSGTWVVGLDQGQFPGATVTTRQMTGPGASSLQYALFSDAARSVNWGNTVGVDTVSGTGTGAAEVLVVYGQIAAGQTSAGSGGYTDTITATITF